MKVFSAVSVTVAMLALATVAMAADPFVGTWKLNVAKTKAQEKTIPTFKSDLVKIEAQENGLKFTFDRVDANGKAIHFTNTAKFDGKDHPTTGNSAFDSFAATRVDANTITRVGKKAGKEVQTGRMVVSKNGKTMTITRKEKNDQGQEAGSIFVYDKQ
jgi:hypothetical protein